MIHTEFLVIGQGISGSWLSYYLEQAGKDFLLMDESDPLSSSRIAAGLINPVTGRRHVTTWMAEELLPFSKQSYENLGGELGISLISETRILDFFPTAQMRVSFMERIGENPFLKPLEEVDAFRPFLHFEFGCGEISPVYMVNVNGFLQRWREKLHANKKLVEEKLDPAALQADSGTIQYADIRARVIIFCDGTGSLHHPWFRPLPFAPNKGEILLARIPELPPGAIYKKGMVIMPLEEPGLFWIGASHEWDFETDTPTDEFFRRANDMLKNFLKLPYQVVDHKAGIRPATLERRPFIGRHPAFPQIAILNGMGSKGCSLAPYFAKQLSDHLTAGLPVDPQADIARFKKILSTTSLK